MGKVEGKRWSSLDGLIPGCLNLDLGSKLEEKLGISMLIMKTSFNYAVVSPPLCPTQILFLFSSPENNLRSFAKIEKGQVPSYSHLGWGFGDRTAS